MNTRVVATFPHTTLKQAARELARLEVSGLPVVDQIGQVAGQVVGIVTETDLLSALLHAASADTPISTIMTESVVTVDEFASADSVIRPDGWLRKSWYEKFRSCIVELVKQEAEALVSPAWGEVADCDVGCAREFFASHERGGIDD